GQQILHFFHTTRRQQSARANQRIPSPIQEPRIAGDDGFAAAAPHEVSLRRQGQTPSERVVRRQPGALERGLIGGLTLLGKRSQLFRHRRREVGREGQRDRAILP